MIEKFDSKQQLQNIQKIIKHTSSLLKFCRDSSKEKYTDLLVEEIQAVTENINRLIEEVKKGNITKEMARIDMNYWTDNNNWKEAKALYDANNYSDGSEAHERLREAMRQMQKSLGALHRSLQQAPAECYQRFLDICFDKAALEKVEKDFDHFKATFITEKNMPQSLVHYLQRVTYRLYERGFLRYALYPLLDLSGRKFEFDFKLLYREGKESEETKFFCVCLNHFLIMPDKYTVLLNKEKIGKYLFDYYENFNNYDKLSISYYEVALDRYNQAMKERGFIEDLDEEAEMNILKRPEAIVLWEKLQKAGIVDEQHMPTNLLSKIQLATVVDLFCASLHIKTTWKPFEELWGIKNLRTYYNKITYTDFYDDFRKKLKDLLAA